MPKTGYTVSQLAAELDTDPDDVLIALWDAGYEYLKSAASPIRPSDRRGARQSLGLADPKELLKVDYWLRQEGVDRAELSARIGMTIGPAARTLPKSALGKLRRQRTAVLRTKAEPVERAITPTRTKFEWAVHGKVRPVQLLSRAEVEEIHWALARDFAEGPDPMSPAGVRDEHLLESAITRPSTSLGEHRKYPTVEIAAAALMHSIVHNHPFHNGNKRTALVAALSMLDRNGIVVETSQDAIFKWTVRVAQHKVGDSNLLGDRSDIEVVAMSQWIHEHSRPLEKLEKPITWKLLRQRLLALDCRVEATRSSGGRLNLTRDVKSIERGLFGIRSEKVRHLSFQMMHHGDGRELSKRDMATLRRELELDEEHGVDSAVFYNTDGTPPDEFIAQYRKTLSRLARI